MKHLLINRYITIYIDKYGSKTKFNEINFNKIMNIDLIIFMNNCNYIFTLDFWNNYFKRKKYFNKFKSILLKIAMKTINMICKTYRAANKQLNIKIYNNIVYLLKKNYDISICKIFYKAIKNIKNTNDSSIFIINEYYDPNYCMFDNNHYIFHFLQIIVKRHIIDENYFDSIKWILDMNTEIKFNYVFYEELMPIIKLLNADFDKYINDKYYVKSLNIMIENYMKYKTYYHKRTDKNDDLFISIIQNLIKLSPHSDI